MMDKTEQFLWDRIYSNWQKHNRLRREAQQLFQEADYKHLLDNERLQETCRDERHQLEIRLTDHYKSLGLNTR